MDVGFSLHQNGWEERAVRVTPKCILRNLHRPKLRKAVVVRLLAEHRLARVHVRNSSGSTRDEPKDRQFGPAATGFFAPRPFHTRTIADPPNVRFGSKADIRDFLR